MSTVNQADVVQSNAATTTGFVSRHAWTGCFLAAALIAWLAAQLWPAHEHVSDRFTHLSWAPATTNTVPSEPGAWTEGGPAGPIGRAIWLRATFQISDEEARKGTADLILSGVFSARATVNGFHIGDKGQPSQLRVDEVPGPIDAAFPLAKAAHAGENELVLLLSSHAARHRPGAVIHDLSIAPEGARANRPLGRYAIALSQAGLILTIAGSFVFAAIRGRNQRWLAWAAAGGAFLLLALAAETARAWWNYAYSLHVVRQTAIWFALVGFAAAIYGATSARFGDGRSGRFIAAGIALNAATTFFGEGIDGRAVLSLIGFAAGSVWICWRPARDGDWSARALAGVLVVWIVFAASRPAEFLDNSLYVLGALTLATFARLPKPAGASKPGAVFDDCSLPPEVAATQGEIVSIKAEGNYIEVRTSNGRRTLLRQALSQFPVAGSLVRVHRSYIVNLSYCRRLVVQTGSRYLLELADQSSIPVSRKLVSEVRGRLNAVKASTEVGFAESLTND